MRVYQEETRWSLAVDSLPDPYHLLCESKLVLLASDVFNGGIRESQVERLVPERHFATRAPYILKFFRPSRNVDVKDGNSIGAPDAVPHLMIPTNVQNAWA